MSTKTIDILLEMQTKPADINKMKAEFDALEKKAQNLQKAIDRVGNGKNADKLNASLAGVKSQIQAIDAEANKRILERNLAKAAEQANRTREKMEKLAQVGNRIALVGGAILAPMVLAMKKYIELAKEDDPLANRFKEIGTQLTDFQVRFGKIIAEQVLPIAEKIIPVVDKVLSFLEANPKLVEFALVIGSALIVGAGIMSTIAQTVGTLATISGLFSDEARLATAGIGTAMSTALAGSLPAIGAIILAVLTNPLTWAVLALLVTKPLMNWLLGTEYTWKDIIAIGKQALFLIGFGIDKLLKGIGGFFANIGASIWSALQKAATFMVEGIGGAVARAFGFAPKKAEGGMIGSGLFIGGERGREFVMSNQTTRAAESVIGGQLTQQSLLAGLAGGRRISYHDNRRIDSSLSNRDRQIIANDTMQILGSVL